MSNNPIVFVVDDEPTVLASLTRLLELSEFDVCAFASTGEFLDSFQPCQRACLLLDVRLAGKTGLELQQEFRSDGVELPVILMSGHASSEVLEKGLAQGAVGFLTKPIDSQRLIELLGVSIDGVNSHCSPL